ncbi:MAG: response regulator transcription factor [Bordetella sp.]|uniref:response regulator transcription factor n=1 Tax=Bordetella sp. TaxID=28081 RepID=UPI003F7CBB70
MVTIAIVEPNALIRMGIQQVLKTLPDDILCVELDYTQLFNGSGNSQIDLMLLAVPDTIELTLQLVEIAQRSYRPQHIVLLSETPILPYSLSDLPPILSGYISKCASADMMMESINVVLAGGTCVPSSSVTAGQICTRPRDGVAPRRRWYEQSASPILNGEPAHPMPANLLAKPGQPCRPMNGLAPSSQTLQPITRADPSAPLPSTELIEIEAALLKLTPRQYMVLALLARGYPMKKISRELNISLATVKTHTEAIYLRLSASNRNGAVYAALSRGASLGWPDLRVSSSSDSRLRKDERV